MLCSMVDALALDVFLKWSCLNSHTCTGVVQETNETTAQKGEELLQNSLDWTGEAHGSDARMCFVAIYQITRKS